ncbi:TPA: glycosyltransferase family 2 protein [Raoultella ornithinolytica]|uniref:glycosyltransferase family 2 protein n=1 Tax=Raoultella ornithinolytica TaxID=54291 RepID=UPI002A5A2800|nr:glycosyltransferase family 2 protein [Raoultella ornithinolytica]WPO25345.1 glycosyltransferase family 2 protein [Raoultella ornithinolytica]HBQ8757372.1 glycosyltransferase family 2 protein [Klebsiella quasipneumoniae]HEP0609341.1 glycosyltransferase family 2 protein [Raoultella ornithinolytica]
MLTINLTTTSERLTLCAATIWSMVHQVRKPDKIRLWISNEPYLSDKGITTLPEWVIEINNIRNILEVIFVENTGPYRKIIPALRTADQNEVLVYADDDVIYDKLWLKCLEDEFNRNDGRYIIASRVRKVKKNILGITQSYHMFPIYIGSEPLKSDFVITGVGGCMLMQKHILPTLLIDNNYTEVAPKADDLWISKIIEKSGSEVKVCPPALDAVQEISHSVNCLSHGNTIYFKGAGIMKIFYKVSGLVFGYLGFVMTDNDKIMRKVSKYFL